MGGSWDYASNNPDAVGRILAAFAPAVGMESMSGPLNIASGLYGMGASGEREKEYAQKYAAAQQAVDAWKKDPKTNPAPTTEQLRVAAGMGAPPPTSAIAAQTTADVAKTSQDVAARRAEAFKRAQQLAGGTIPSLQALPFSPRPIFAPGGSQGLLAQGNRTGGNQADLLARLLLAIKAQGGA